MIPVNGRRIWSGFDREQVNWRKIIIKKEIPKTLIWLISAKFISFCGYSYTVIRLLSAFPFKIADTKVSHMTFIHTLLDDKDRTYQLHPKLTHAVTTNLTSHLPALVFHYQTRGLYNNKNHNLKLGKLAKYLNASSNNFARSQLKRLWIIKIKT